MPYRRLPNTDQARLRSLNRALEKGEILNMHDLAFSQKIFVEIRGFLPTFSKALFEYKQALDNQVSNNQKYQEKLKKARLYINHFIQVLNLAVMRGEIKEEYQPFYGLEEGCKAVPDLTSEASLVEWGEKIIDGEAKRLSKGGSPLYSPSIANVKVRYEIFKEAYNKQKVLQNNTTRHLDIVAQQRETADSIILELWNEVEERFSTVTDQEERLNSCRDYGLIYYYRKGEKIKKGSDSSSSSIEEHPEPTSQEVTEDHKPEEQENTSEPKKSKGFDYPSLF